MELSERYESDRKRRESHAFFPSVRIISSILHPSCSFPPTSISNRTQVYGVQIFVRIGGDSISQ